MSQPESKPFSNPSGLRTHRGSCHCGAVRFEAELDLDAGATTCNCTSCIRVNARSVIMKPSAFRLTGGQEAVTHYQREGSSNGRSFCKHCGSQVFAKGHVPEIGGDYVSVNLNCVEEIDPALVKLSYFDGRHNNWYAGTRPTPWPVMA